MQIFQKGDRQITLHRITTRENTAKAISEGIRNGNFDAVLAAGGDGTIHQVINILQREKIELPLGIIPAGTANDLAFHLGMSPNIEKSCEMLLHSSVGTMDLGKVNDIYFVNVASAGLLTDVAYNTSLKFKQIAGKLAYYLKGLEKIPLLRSVPMRFEWEGGVIEEEVLLFLILNGSAAGGFTTLAPNTRIEDGKLDVLIFKSCAFTELVNLFIMLLRGEHLKSDKLRYFQTEKFFKIECAAGVPTDLDGEPGPQFPLEIKVVEKAQRILIPKHSM